jgi:hypothetical protein
MGVSFKQCPRFPGVHHFKNGVTGLKYITGAEHGQILRVCFVLSHSHLSQLIGPSIFPHF